MAEENAAPAEAGTVDDSKQITMEKSFNDALTALEGDKGTVEEEPEVEGKAEETDAPESETDEGTAESPETDPDHIKWAKSINGDYDPEKGEFNIDRIVKRAYELNKQNQSLAQETNWFKQLLEKPELSEIIARGMNKGNGAEDKGPEDSVDEDAKFFDEYPALKKLNERLKSLEGENSKLFADRVRTETVNAYTKLKEEFGNNEEGKPIYDTVRDEVGKQLMAAASQANITVQEFVSELVKRDMLYSTLSATARNILYPKLYERINKLTNSRVEEKKKANLPKKGTPSTSVKQAETKVNTMSDAFKAAEAEHPEFKELS